MLSHANQNDYLNENASIHGDDSLSIINKEFPMRPDLISRAKWSLMKAFFDKTSVYSYEQYFDASDETYYSAYGEFEVSYGYVFSKDSKLLGAEVQVFQRGCQNDELQDSSGNHYTNIEEAKADNCDTDADVSWSTYLFLDLKGELIDELSSDHFEWSGH
jgi:hypothetical protein